jgi:hypothetical protein
LIGRCNAIPDPRPTSPSEQRPSRRSLLEPFMIGVAVMAKMVRSRIRLLTMTKPGSRERKGTIRMALLRGSAFRAPLDDQNERST